MVRDRMFFVAGVILTGIVIILLTLGLSYFKKEDSGVRGAVTIGPVCPVQRIPPDPQCADRPYKTDFNITNKYGYLVKRVSSDASGKFSEVLLPGFYRIVPVGSGMLPRAAAQNFTVPSSGFVDLSIKFDSGIR